MCQLFELNKQVPFLDLSDGIGSGAIEEVIQTTVGFRKRIKH